MRKILFIISILLLLVSCTSINPYDVPEGTGSYLKNREELNGNARYLYLFKNAVTESGKKSFSPGATTWEQEEVYRIPSGEITLGLTILYAHNYSAGPTKYLDANKYHEIHVIKSSAAHSELDGIKINAIEGRTYQINCKIESGRAYIWIEDDSGTKISEIVGGLQEVGYQNRVNWYSPWENLPDPVD